MSIVSIVPLCRIVAECHLHTAITHMAVCMVVEYHVCIVAECHIPLCRTRVSHTTVPHRTN